VNLQEKLFSITSKGSIGMEGMCTKDEVSPHTVYVALKKE